MYLVSRVIPIVKLLVLRHVPLHFTPPPVKQQLGGIQWCFLPKHYHIFFANVMIVTADIELEALVCTEKAAGAKICSQAVCLSQLLTGISCGFLPLCYNLFLQASHRRDKWYNLCEGTWF